MGELALALMLLALVIGTAWIASARNRRERRGKLAAIAREVGGAHDSSSVTCTYNGVVVRYEFAMRGAGSSAESWTEVTADLPRGYPLSLRVLRCPPQPEAVRRGDLIDVEVGDADFDRAFLVEAAPSDVVRALLDAPARAFLVQFGGMLVTLTKAGGGTALQLALPGWDEHPMRAKATVEGVSRIASRLREAYADANAAIPTGDAGSPYRPQVDDSPIKAAEARRVHEVAHLAALEQQRADAERRMGVLVVSLVTGTLIAAIVGLRVCVAGT